MRKLGTILAVLSGILLGAHFLRSGHFAVTALCLGGPLLLFVRRSWSVTIVQAGLLFGALEWLRTLMFLKQARQAAGQPYVRLIVILVAVALVAAAASFLLGYRTRPSRLPTERPAL